MDQDARLRDIAARIRRQASAMAGHWRDSKGGSKEHFDFMAATTQGHFNDLAAEIDGLLAKQNGE